MSGVTIHEIQRPFHLWVPSRNDYLLAHFIFDYSIEEHIYWFGPMQSSGEWWMLENTLVRADSNPTIGRIVAKDTWVQNRMPDPEAK